MAIEWNTEKSAGSQRDLARCKTCKAVHTRLWTVTTTRTYRSDRCVAISRSTAHAVAEQGPQSCCDRLLSYRPVKGTRNAEIVCNAKCTGSKGWVCECSCGGKNHGAGHAAH